MNGVPVLPHADYRKCLIRLSIGFSEQGPMCLLRRGSAVILFVSEGDDEDHNQVLPGLKLQTKSRESRGSDQEADRNGRVDRAREGRSI